MSIHVNMRLLEAAKRALFILESPLASPVLNGAGGIDELREAIEAAENGSKRAKRSPATEPDECSPYAPARFLPLRPYKQTMRDWQHAQCEVTFEDGAKIRAYAFREPGKPIDIGRPARAAVEKYKHRRAPKDPGCSVPFLVSGWNGFPVPEIVELRDTETGEIFDISLANHGTAEMRSGAL